MRTTKKTIKIFGKLLADERLMQAAGLTEREKYVIKQYWINELTFDQISKPLLITRERVSQLHELAILKLINLVAKAPMIPVLENNLARYRKFSQHITSSETIDQMLKTAQIGKKLYLALRKLNIEYKAELIFVSEKHLREIGGYGNKTIDELNSLKALL